MGINALMTSCASRKASQVALSILQQPHRCIRSGKTQLYTPFGRVRKANLPAAAHFATFEVVTKLIAEWAVDPFSLVFWVRIRQERTNSKILGPRTTRDAAAASRVLFSITDLAHWGLGLRVAAPSFHPATSPTAGAVIEAVLGTYC